MLLIIRAGLIVCIEMLPQQLNTQEIAEFDKTCTPRWRVFEAFFSKSSDSARKLSPCNFANESNTFILHSSQFFGMEFDQIHWRLFVGRFVQRAKWQRSRWRQRSVTISCWIADRWFSELRKKRYPRWNARLDTRQSRVNHFCHRRSFRKSRTISRSNQSSASNPCDSLNRSTGRPSKSSQLRRAPET